MNNTLYIIGNGKSFNPEYLNLLTHKDTMGMNLGFRGFQQYNFYPTYYGFFEYDPSIYRLCNTDEVDEFLERGYPPPKVNYDIKLPPNIFALKSTNLKNKNTQYINLKIDKVDYNTPNCPVSPPLNTHIETLIKNLEHSLPSTYKERVREISNNPQLWALNSTGLIKYITERKSLITMDDFIVTPRVPPPFVLPTSFDDFYWQKKYNSSIMCVMIGMILGYRKFILMGMDSNFTIKDQKLDYKDNYWFSGESLDLNNLLPPTKGDFNNIHMDAWWNFLQALMINNASVEIINTTIASPLCNMFKTKALMDVV